MHTHTTITTMIVIFLMTDPLYYIRGFHVSLRFFINKFNYHLIKQSTSPIILYLSSFVKNTGYGLEVAFRFVDLGNDTVTKSLRIVLHLLLSLVSMALCRGNQRVR